MNLQQILDELGLTIYGASCIIGAETDEPLSTIHKRWSRWLQSEPKSLQQLQEDLDALGYKIQITKK